MYLTGLKKAREAKGLSYADVAKLAGISHMTVRRAESGQDIHPLMGESIAKALHTTTEALCMSE